MNPDSGPLRRRDARGELVALLLERLRARQHRGRVVGKAGAGDVDEDVGHFGGLEERNRLRPVAGIEPAAAVVPHRPDLALARRLTRGIRAQLPRLRLDPRLVRGIAPALRLHRADQCPDELRLEVFVAVGREDVGHPVTAAGGNPRRLAGGAAAAVGPGGEHPSLAGLGRGAQEHRRGLANRRGQSLGNARDEVHAAPRARIRRGGVAVLLHVHQVRERRRGGVEHHQLAAARTKRLKRAHFVRRRIA